MPVRSIKIMNVLAFQDQFTLTFSDGINVIIGGNGTGKTTLLKIINGDMPSDGGEISIARDARIGFPFVARRQTSGFVMPASPTTTKTQGRILRLRSLMANIR